MQYIYSIYIYIYIYIYILDVLVARTANFQRCQLAFCLRVVYVCFYSQLICIYYIDFLHCCNRTLNLLKRYATRTSTTYTATTRTITSTLPTTTTTTTTTRCLGVRPSHFLPFSFYTLYIYIREYIEIRVYAIIRDFLSFFTSYYELPPNCVGFAINNSTVLSRMRSSTTLQFMLRFALSVTSWIGRAK